MKHLEHYLKSLKHGNIQIQCLYVYVSDDLHTEFQLMYYPVMIYT